LTNLKFKNISLCSSCKRRPAFYYRKQSGEALCKVCLERSVVKQVKKAIGAFSLLIPKSKILIPLIPDKPYESVLTSIIISPMERKYLSHTYISSLFPLSQELVNQIAELTKSIILPVNSHLMNEGQMNYLNFVENQLQKLFHLASDHEINYVVLPYTRNDFMILFILSLIYRRSDFIKEYLSPKISKNSINLIYPLYYVLRSDIYALIIKYKNVLSRVPIPKKIFNDVETVKLVEKLVMKLNIENPELLYSYDKILNLFAKQLF